MNYFFRAGKYFLSLVILYLVVVYGLSATGFAAIEPNELLANLIESSRGRIMVVAVFALSLTYPIFGFMKQEVAGDLKENRDQILSTFEANNYKLVKDEDGEMIFSNNNLLKRITFLFEDKISVSQVGDKLVVEGIRRAVPFIIYRLEGAISFSDDNK